MPTIIISKNKKIDNVIIFVHIPKTGGLSLQNLIHKQYENSCDIWIDIDKKKKIPWQPKMDIEKKNRIQVVKGHQHFGIHKELPQKKHIYITILRDPIERVISNYYFVQKVKNSNLKSLHNLFNEISLYEYVTRENFIYKEENTWDYFFGGIPNLQTRILAGIGEGDNLEKAKYNLKKYFSIIGITERYNETLYIIEKKLGWEIQDYKKVNTTKNRPKVKEISNEIIEIIRGKNEKDIELYKYANTILENELKNLNNNS